MAKSPPVAGSEGLPVDRTDDEVLLGSFLRGEASAFDELVRRHQGRLARLAWRLLGWDAQADDVVQDVFLAALKNAHRFRGQGSVGNWLAAIAVRKCRSLQRRAAVRQRFLRSASPPTRLAPAGAVDEAAMAGETFDHVHRAIRALPGRLREVIDRAAPATGGPPSVRAGPDRAVMAQLKAFPSLAILGCLFGGCRLRRRAVASTRPSRPRRTSPASSVSLGPTLSANVVTSPAASVINTGTAG